MITLVLAFNSTKRLRANCVQNAYVKGFITSEFYDNHSNIPVIHKNM